MQVSQTGSPSNATTHAADATSAPVTGASSSVSDPVAPVASSATAIPEALRQVPRRARSTVGNVTAADGVALPPGTPSLQALDQELIKHIGSFLPLGGKHLSRLASVSKHTSQALKSHALADGLTACIESPPPFAVANGHFASVAMSASELPDPLRLEVTGHLLKVIPRHVSGDDQGVAATCTLLRGLVAGFDDGATRLRLMLDFAAMLDHPELRWIGDRAPGQGQPHPPIIQVRNAFAADCKKFVTPLGGNGRLSQSDRAELFGALARAMYCTAPQPDDANEWQALAGRTDCGAGDTRLPLLKGLTAAVSRLPAGASREAAFNRMLKELAALSPPKRVTLLEELTVCVEALDAEPSLNGTDSRTMHYAELHQAAGQLPIMHRGKACEALIEALGCLPVQRRQAHYDAFCADLSHFEPQQQALLISALAQVNEILPSLESQVAAINALFAGLAGLESTLRAEAGQHVIDAIGRLPGEEQDVIAQQRSDEQVQICFAEAIRFTDGCAPADRRPMIESLIVSSGAINSVPGRVGVCHTVVELIGEQPQDERTALLQVMYERLPEETDNEIMNVLMSLYDRAAARLPPADRALLADCAAGACTCMEGTLMRSQFKVVLRRIDTLPHPYQAEALESARHALATGVDTLYMVSAAQRRGAFDDLLATTAMLPVTPRVDVLRKLGMALEYFDGQMFQVAAGSLTAEIMRLPHQLRASVLVTFQL